MQFNTGSIYEDIEAVARISSGDIQLTSDFELWQQEVLQNFYRLTGRILNEADRQKLIRERRPHFEWNLYHPILLQIASNFRNSIPGLEVIGITEGDHKTADLQKKLNEFHLYQANDIEYELAKAFLWSLAARISWLYQDYTFSDPKYPEGKILINHYESLKIKFDPNWTRRDVQDMNFMDNTRWLSPEEITNIYAKNKPDMREEVEEKSITILGYSSADQNNMKKMIATWAERVFNMVLPSYSGEDRGYDADDSNFMYNLSGQWYNNRGKFYVIDWYERRATPTMEILDVMTGQTKDVTDQVRRKDVPGYYAGRDWFDQNILQQVKAQFGQPYIIESRPNKIWQTTVCPALNMKLYDNLQNIQNGYFKFIPVLCFDFHPNIMETKSVIDLIKGPVQSANLRRNTMLTYLMRAAHGGYLAEEGYVKAYMQDFLKNEIGGVKRVKDGGLSQGRIKEITVPPFPASLDRFVEEEVNAIKEISGSTDNTRGKEQTGSENASLYSQRVQQAEQMQEWISSNAQSSLLIIGYNNIALQQKYMKYPRTVLLLQDETDPYWLQINQRALDQIMNDVTVGSYTLRLSKVPYGRKAKDMEYQKVLEFYTMQSKLAPQYINWRLLAKLSGVSVYKEIIKYMDEIDGQMADLAKQVDAVKQFNEDQQMMRTMAETSQFIQQSPDFNNPLSSLAMDDFAQSSLAQQIPERVA